MQPTREFRLTNLSIAASVKTDPGCVRETNEDNGRHVNPFAPEARSLRGTLTIVADGMGGHSSGEVASEMAVDLICYHYYADEENSIPDALNNAVVLASSEIYEASVQDEKYFGMGTTVVALAIQGPSAYAAHVGDSRLYRMRERTMELLTIDHSQVMEMVKLGIISYDEAQTHEDKNVILRAVGTQPSVEVEISGPFAVDVGDEFLLCSDGLCDMVGDDEISRIWVDAVDIHSAAEQLIDVAKERGGNDNITVGIVRVSAEAETEVARKVPVTREVEIS